MSWIRFDDNWIDSERVEELGSEAVALHLSALSYCARQGTDGWLRQSVLRRLWPVMDMAATVAALEAAGEWEAHDDGWQLTKWRDHLLSADEVKKRQDQTKVRTERWRRHNGGDHSMCGTKYCPYASRDASQTKSPTLPLPVPSLPEAKREGRGGESPNPDSARAPSDIGRPTKHPARGSDPYLCECQLPKSHPAHLELTA